MPGAPYIPIEKAIAAVALRDVGHSYKSIEAMTGVSDSSVADILNRRGHWGEILDSPVFAKLRVEQNRALELAARTMAAQLWIEAVKPEKLEKASTYQLVGSASWLIDKAQLLAGLPTEITATMNVNVAAKLDQLASRLAETLINPSNDGMDLEKPLP